MEWFDLVVALLVILLGAQLFTNGVEWVGEGFGLSEGMVGSVLAAIGTALPETTIPIVAILAHGHANAEEIGIGAILGRAVHARDAGDGGAGGLRAAVRAGTAGRGRGRRFDPSPR